ncbi:hypothetical protein BI308_24130 [Roseofilum reptotaenium AO1-A]|uniref:DUF2141 domain-containing protein n=1 Tax=Roseofilum reptotaenium AO1-A TaxID=1925591 RepID=A0A1L9QK31_9CYAN|nr:hypothetical protein [Roseofilum reptotaenium]OJJ15738.1 hypothetical protein BI308_24130 [Roseofilum reptotaenium AO1-A]
MSDIFITIRNQEGYAMASHQGTLFVAIIQQDGTLISQKPVNWRWADAQFPDLPPGQYTAIAFHESVNPPETSQDVTLGANELLEVRFIYLEPEQQLLDIRIREFPLDL